MAVQFKDYYQILGVPKTATKDEIRSAFRKLARVHHPDVAKDKKNAEAKFKEINEAYEVLGDPEKRQKYDTLGADWDQPGAGRRPGGGGGFPGGGGGGGGMGGFPGGGGATFGGTGFSDFFEQFFSGRGGRAAASNPFGGMGGEAETGGEDIEADLLVSLEEVYHGAKKKISFQREGSARTETYEVRIPQGVGEGQKIRLAGQGGAAARGRAAGDLYLRVRYEKHPDYAVDGSDLTAELDVPAWKAVLGGDIEVRTPDGAVRLKLPAGSQPGRKMRLKARGLPGKGGTRGDFYIKIDVSLPTDLTPEERELWEKLATHWH